LELLAHAQQVTTLTGPLSVNHTTVTTYDDDDDDDDDDDKNASIL
jgi:hypothetical protein